jgi:hypothetical protein
VEAFSQHGERELIEYVPAGQTAASWQRKIIIETYHNLTNLPLDTLQRRAAAQNRDACDGVVEGKFQSGMVNGFATAFWTTGCKRDRRLGTGEARYTKVIQGGTGLYLISHTWRTAPYLKGEPNIDPRDIDSAMAFLTSSIVCDPANARQPCPAEAPAQR